MIYLYGNEDEPVVLDRRSPVLHLVQLIRDESHRFAVGYHRQRRAMRDRDSELLNIPGVGALTRQRLLAHFGSLRDVQQATAESLAAVVPRKDRRIDLAAFPRAAACRTLSPLAGVPRSSASQFLQAPLADVREQPAAGRYASPHCGDALGRL